MDGMDDIVQEFLIESHENLDQLDQDLIEMESAEDAREILARIFRTIHTIKGTSGFLAFNQLEAVAHVGENLLSRLRDGRMDVTHDNTDALLLMTDTIRNLLANIEESGNDSGLETAHVVERIKNTYENPQPADEGGAAPAGEAAPPAEAVPAEAAPTEPAPEVAAPPAPAAAAPAAPAEPATPASPPPPANVPAAAEAPAAPAGGNAAPSGPPKRSAADSVVRVDVDLLDELMLLVGELVLTRNQIVQYSTQQTDQTLVRSSQRLNLIATELQEGVMKTRMQPIDHLWSKFPRVVRDLGSQCGKQVKLEMVGKETELDRTLLEAVKDPLTHLIRNAVDHGIETPDIRTADGKSAAGTLTLRAYHEGGQVVVEVRDDGKGIDGDIIAQKAIEKGLRTEAQVGNMSTQDKLQLIFMPGFSTAAKVTNVSGRGVGMDVVKSNIESIGGAIEIESKVGNGSVFRLRIPLTLAIVPALTVECSDDIYAIPQVNLLELVALDTESNEQKLEDVGGVPVYRLRGNLLPLVHLSEVLQVEALPEDGQVTIAVLQAEGRRFGLVLDKVISTEEIVVKPLSAALKNLGTYSGATILGNGRVALILDVQALARRALSDAVEAEQQRYEESIQLSDENKDQGQVLVAGIGDGRQVGIPLQMVTRLEEVATSDIEYVGNREVLQYRGAILPLLRLDRHLGAYTDGGEEERLPLVVYTEHDRSIAIVVSEILDIVDDKSTRTYDIDDHGLVGSAVIRDKVVELLDVRAAIIAVDPVFFDKPATTTEWGAEEANKALEGSESLN